VTDDPERFARVGKGFSAVNWPTWAAWPCSGSWLGTNRKGGRGGDGGSQMKMLSGFNHNIRFRGKVYHVQTEDGGRTTADHHARVPGRAILDSVRTSYADLLERPNWQADLKDRMKAQHLEEIGG